ncbi:hypothetical protein L6164_024732 [Bauhinia variegata]|uniref:Uncharacterized protein n=1 Tax=Bauhinia variegata TaxID=167791 RepID=A0ACB9LZV5_BAUVA|nr:hypothetical protein L6164_024732 [Bauhinia variegata]
MALRKALTKRLLDGFRTSSPSATLQHTAVPSTSLQTIVPPNASKSNFHREYIPSPESADKVLFRPFLHRRAVYHCGPTRLPEFLSLSVGENLREKLKGLNITGDRLRLDGLCPPPTDHATGGLLHGISVNDAKKILKVSQVERLKAKLREIPKTTISYAEFIRICGEGCENGDQGAEFGKLLDESGNVIVLGDVVFLRPEQVAKTMERLISETIAIPNDPRRRDLELMEKQKAMIDEKAQSLVRGELYCGLGLLMAQTLGFMRLTFWELSWDVMEPICFFFASLNFAIAYLFFLRTSREPTFQGYFYHRFMGKQKRLMQKYKFDMEKYNELRKACYPGLGLGFDPLLGATAHHSSI